MLIAGLSGTRLTCEESAWLQAPQLSGVILFTRNFTDMQQLHELIAHVRDIRGQHFLLCIDQEGGPVQRLKNAPMTRLPALARLGELHDRDPQAAVELAEQHAWLMASEIRALDIDLSFAPVLDLRRGNRVIGERALHADPDVVADLAQACVRGMHLAGMAATLKHFPGHGTVLEDTHVDDASDPRSLQAMQATDLLPFAACIESGAEAVMMAHVSYPKIDSKPAGYSSVWIRDILRGEMGFQGIVFSDDIAMAAAATAGALDRRIHEHLDAGCDLVLVCKPDWTAAAIDAARGLKPCPEQSISPLLGSVAPDWKAMIDNPKHSEAVARVTSFAQSDDTA